MWRRCKACYQLSCEQLRDWESCTKKI